MKKIASLLSLLMLVTGSLLAQDTFEGTLKYQVKYMGDGADQMAMVAPSENTYTVLGDDFRFKMNGMAASFMGGEILRQGATGDVYIVDDMGKKATKLLIEENTEKPQKPTITELDETITILGHKCQKYSIEVKTKSGTNTQFAWVTKDLKMPNIDGSKKGVGNSGAIFLNGIEGMIMKFMININIAGMEVTSIMTATDLNLEKPDPALFIIPADYKIEEKNPKSMFGG